MVTTQGPPGWVHKMQHDLIIVLPDRFGTNNQEPVLTDCTCCDAVVHHVESMHPNLFSSSFDVLELVLGLDAHILDLADWFINVRDLCFLGCFDTLRCNLRHTRGKALQCIFMACHTKSLLQLFCTLKSAVALVLTSKQQSMLVIH